jgi:hypothetical protein
VAIGDVSRQWISIESRNNFRNYCFVVVFQNMCKRETAATINRHACVTPSDPKTSWLEYFFFSLFSDFRRRENNGQWYFNFFLLFIIFLTSHFHIFHWFQALFSQDFTYFLSKTCTNFQKCLENCWLLINLSILNLYFCLILPYFTCHLPTFCQFQSIFELLTFIFTTSHLPATNGSHYFLSIF